MQPRLEQLASCVGALLALVKCSHIAVPLGLEVGHSYTSSTLFDSNRVGVCRDCLLILLCHDSCSGVNLYLSHFMGGNRRSPTVNR